MLVKNWMSKNVVGIDVNDSRKWRISSADLAAAWSAS
jgi:hypothetical protein